MRFGAGVLPSWKTTSSCLPITPEAYMSMLTLLLPDSVTTDEARLLLAIKLFEVGKVSCGKAAEIAGKHKRDFMDILGAMSIPIANYPAEEVARDFENA
jgi:predicted HTH domain antitoxin